MSLKEVQYFSLQTGSGKTYTMTGNLNHLEDRGVTMRCIEYFFQHFEQVIFKEILS